jgi:hypothetical protein
MRVLLINPDVRGPNAVRKRAVVSALNVAYQHAVDAAYGVRAGVG